MIHIEALPRNTGSIFEMEPETREAPVAQHGLALAVTLALTCGPLLIWWLLS